MIRTTFKTAALAATLALLAGGAQANVAGSPGSAEYDMVRNFLPASCGFTYTQRGRAIFNETSLRFATSGATGAVPAIVRVNAATVQNVVIDPGAPPSGYTLAGGRFENPTVTGVSGSAVSRSGTGNVNFGSGSIVITIADPSLATVFDVTLPLGEVQYSPVPPRGFNGVQAVAMVCNIAAGV
jgi:hypothetical protein